MMNPVQRPTIAASVVRAVAVAASVDPRTVRRYARGEPVALMCAVRIERALAGAGLHEVIAAAYARRRSNSSEPPEGAPPSAA
jgi:hypothetical protein